MIRMLPRLFLLGFVTLLAGLGLAKMLPARTLSLVAVVHAQQPRVTVCHRRLNGEFGRIEVASRAVQAHLNHGDAEPGDAVPFTTGLVFDDACEPAPGPFNFTGGGGADVDVISPGTSFEIVASGPGTIADLNVSVHLFNDGRLGALYPRTMAWGDLGVTLSKDGVFVQLWSQGNPGELTDLFVVLDDEAIIPMTLNDVLLTAPEGPTPTVEPQHFMSGMFTSVNPNAILASYRPEGDLSDFDGLNLAGTWTLTIVDDSCCPGESDSLLGWQIFGAAE